MENTKKKKIAIIAGISVAVIAAVIIIIAVLANNGNSQPVDVNDIDPGVKVTVYFNQTEISEAGYVKGGKVMIDTSKLEAISSGEMKLSDIEGMEEYVVVVENLDDGMKVFISEANTSDGNAGNGSDDGIIGTNEDDTDTLTTGSYESESTDEENPSETVETVEEEPEITPESEETEAVTTTSATTPATTAYTTAAPTTTEATSTVTATNAETTTSKSSSSSTSISLSDNIVYIEIGTTIGRPLSDFFN